MPAALERSSFAMPFVRAAMRSAERVRLGDDDAFEDVCGASFGLSSAVFAATEFSNALSTAENARVAGSLGVEPFFYLPYSLLPLRPHTSQRSG